MTLRKRLSKFIKNSSKLLISYDPLNIDNKTYHSLITRQQQHNPITKDIKNNQLKEPILIHKAFFAIPKIYLHQDVMKSILERFLDSKGVPEEAIKTVIGTKSYYRYKLI